MLEEKKLPQWSLNYWNQVKRNIGIIKIKEQEKIRNSCIAILGVGGLGGPLAEQLIRVGCENLIICDNDKFDNTNLNRQLCTLNHIGKKKINVLESYLKEINRNSSIQKYFLINEKNINQILNSVDIIALTLDDPVISILVSREARRKKIPVIESYGIPFLFAWWYTPESIDFESFYGFNTKDKSFEEISNSASIISDLQEKIRYKLLKFPKIKRIYNREEDIFREFMKGTIPSINIAPFIRLTASYLSFEIIFSGILNLKQKTLAPNTIAYDYFNMKKIQMKMD